MVGGVYSYCLAKMLAKTTGLSHIRWVDICINIYEKTLRGVRVEDREKVKASYFIDSPKTPANSQGHWIDR